MAISTNQSAMSDELDWDEVDEEIVAYTKAHKRRMEMNNNSTIKNTTSIRENSEELEMLKQRVRELSNRVSHLESDAEVRNSE
jgi:polyhydroxyalkanoate synthesis regulator phasin